MPLYVWGLPEIYTMDHIEGSLWLRLSTGLWSRSLNEVARMWNYLQTMVPLFQ